jgi:GTP-binding protein
MDGTEPLENYRSIRHELTCYRKELGERSEILVVSKAELPEALEVQRQLTELTGNQVLLISAVTGQGLMELVRRIGNELEKVAAASAKNETVQ